jgi:deazaflavin-dependent oxidoreductase (nitroreductase family)
MKGNDFVRWLLRSPFHGMLSQSMMLITVTGCKTGKKYTTPVGYYRENGNLWIITNRDRTWWKNLKNGADVSVLLQRQLRQGHADLELDEELVRGRMVEYLQHEPRAIKPLGIRVVDGIPNTDDVARATQSRLFVRVTLS